MKNILIISSSPRKGGNSDVLCDRFLAGALESGNVVEKIRICEKKINYCTGCGYCNTHNGRCAQKDDMSDIMHKMKSADVIVFATPVYFYTMCGQMKTFIDRCCPIYVELKGKEFYYIVSAADSEIGMMQKTVEEFRGLTIDCVPDAVEKGVIYGVGAWQIGEIKHTDSYEKAYEIGKKV